MRTAQDQALELFKKSGARIRANVEAGKPLKSAVHKTCKSSGPQPLKIPACLNESSGVLKSDD